jgi:hypothetical protein
MKMRIAVAALAAMVTLSLTACGSQTKGTAVPGLGGGLGAPSVATAPGTGNGGGTEGTGTDGATTDGTTADGTTADGTTTDGTTADGPATDQSSRSALPGMPAGCQELANLAQDFTSKILQKAMNGGVTQADVDAVFSDANMAKLPDSVKGDAATLKDLSQQMVGKQVTELTDILPKVQTTFQSIAGKVTKACGG